MRIIGKALILLVASIVLLSPPVPAAGKGNFSTSPKTNNGEKWRIGYYEGGQYTNYYKYFHATIKGLMDLGWIEKTEIPVHENQRTDLLWDWVSTKAESRYIQFVKDSYYTAHWDQDIREKTAAKIIARFNTKNDIDLMIAMGTWAGKDLANNRHHTNVAVISTSDPIGSGIIESIEDSGFDHIHARVDPFRYERQIRIFHDLIKFKKLGIAYENTIYGKSYVAVDIIEKVAKDLDFEIYRCFTLSDIADQSVAGKSVIDCFEKLAPQVDAIYVTRQGGVNSETIPRLVEIANKHRLPMFSQSGSKEVKYGFLISISRAGGFKPAGRFFAATFAQVFNGAKPRQLNQLFEESPNIAINLKTAEIIGLYLYADFLAAADEIYRDIETPK